MSLVLYGHHLRLLAVMEILLYLVLYDGSSTDYYSPYRADNQLVLSAYGDFVQRVVKDGNYSDMLTVLVLSVLSAVVQKLIQTR